MLTQANANKIPLKKLGPYDLNQIITGDAKELSKVIPDESIDLIFTDPVYQNIEDYRWLAETAARVLKPDRACLVFCGISWLGETIIAMQEYLSWRWQLILSMPYRNGSHIKGGFSHYASCLWFEKGMSNPVHKIPDTRLWKPAIGPFHWAKNPDFISYYLFALANKGPIFDPFVGSGTVPAVCKMLAKNYLAFEINPETANLARQRVEQTQPPLFVVEPVQDELWS